MQMRTIPPREGGINRIGKLAEPVRASRSESDQAVASNPHRSR